MRPVNKGGWPLHKKSKVAKLLFNDWTRAIPHLVFRTGRYCHLCEMKVTNALAIEHIQPKEHFPHLSNDWDNFLLICSYCNSEKLDTIPTHDYRVNYFWPHLNNTLQVFDIDLTNGFIVPKNNLDAVQTSRANELIGLYGLNKVRNSSGGSDPRFLERLEALLFAVNRRVEYDRGEATLNAIIDFAKTKGFFSIWLKIFDSIPAVRSALINCVDFKVPIAECFDASLALKARNQADL